MKNKEYSKWLKLLIVILTVVASVLKWFGIMGNASVLAKFGMLRVLRMLYH